MRLRNHKWINFQTKSYGFLFLVLYHSFEYLGTRLASVIQVFFNNVKYICEQQQQKKTENVILLPLRPLRKIDSLCIHN